MKKSLKNAIGKRMLNIEELRTLLPEIKYVMNSRPLTYVYNKNEDFDILRPLDLVQPLRITDEIKFEDLETDNYVLKSTQKIDIINSWKNAQKTVNDFWDKFQKEYLNDLKERAERHTQKHFKRNYLPNIGEIVLIQNTNIPKQFWNMGRIVNLIKSKDGSIRSAKIKCKNKIINRAIALLYPLELSIYEENNNPEKTSKIVDEKIVNDDKQKKNPYQLRERKIKQKIIEDSSSDEEIESGRCNMFFEDNRYRPCAYCGGPHMDYECVYYQSNSHQREVPQRNQQKNSQKESKYNKLIAENKEIKNELENINEDIAELQDWEEEFTDIKKSSKELEIKNKKLEEELNECKNKINSLEEKIVKSEEGFESKFNEMKIENERIKNDMKRVIRDIYVKPPEKTKTKKASSKNTKNKQKVKTERKEKGMGTSASALKTALTNTIGAISIILFLTLIGSIHAGPCKLSEKTTPIELNECLADGFTINKRKDGTICWKKIKLENTEKIKHLQNNKCLCPSWAISCSFYTGKETKTSTQNNKQIMDIIERNKPNICSFNPDPKCKVSPIIKTLYQIELYDGSKFFVKELNIELKETINEEIQCIGKGEITGSPLYCAKNHCSERGRKFCFFIKNEIAYFNKFPVKAWGSIEKQIFDFKNEKDKECHNCKLECTEEGVRIDTDTNLGGIEICLEKCIYISFPEMKQEILLPKEELINGYDVKGILFKNGENIKEIIRK
uniref:DUF5641 domain-containing protein n=1 Tax=Meloidogyne enterolobii TaxID=390850 RepID=A0A6V7Y467_MELEN|nr:unnamed protein product [Meloidogyne enterolobii]